MEQNSNYSSSHRPATPSTTSQSSQPNLSPYRHAHHLNNVMENASPMKDDPGRQKVNLGTLSTLENRSEMNNTAREIYLGRFGGDTDALPSLPRDRRRYEHSKSPDIVADMELSKLHAKLHSHPSPLQSTHPSTLATDEPASQRYPLSPIQFPHHHPLPKLDTSGMFLPQQQKLESIEIISATGGLPVSVDSSCIFVDAKLIIPRDDLVGAQYDATSNSFASNTLPNLPGQNYGPTTADTGNGTGAFEDSLFIQGFISDIALTYMRGQI